jgi:RecB family endonuclease NucS
LAVPPDPALPAEPVAEKQRLSLERDMQVALRDNIARLDPSLSIIDDGAERAVASGFIDILARDAAGVLVVIELKAGKTDARVIGQTLGYMGDILAEEDAPVRGIIVAHDFDQRTISAARAVPNLSLTRYAISFSFTPEV